MTVDSVNTDLEERVAVVVVAEAVAAVHPVAQLLLLQDTGEREHESVEPGLSLFILLV